MEYKLRYFIPLAVIITTIFFSMHVITQQMLRQAANDPQIQLSEDIATVLSNSKPVEGLMPPQVELTKSIAPFVIVYDENGKVISSTATLNGTTPELPEGVLAFTKANGQDRITWQPQENVREAAVITYFSGKNSGYVLVGKSLREVEIREDHILKLAGMGWVATIVGALIATVLFVKSPKK